MKGIFWAIDCRGQRSVVIEYRPLIITVQWQCKGNRFSQSRIGGTLLTRGFGNAI